MLFVMKFNQRLFAAARPTAMAIQCGDEVGAMREASQMAAAAQPLVLEASRKASGALIGGNDQVYASMAQQAQMVVEAGRSIASADQKNGTFDRSRYDRGVALLNAALAGGA